MESVKVAESLAGVEAAEWNALAGTQPFVRHEFLSALIETGCASARSGWRPQFSSCAAPARWWRRCRSSPSRTPTANTCSTGPGRKRTNATASSYYPKLLSAIPFTPVRGPRLLGKDKEVLVEAALDLARDTSSLHVLFPAEDELRRCSDSGMMLRRTVQFHWRNAGYTDFEDFLRRMNHARRKNIRQERRKVRDAGISLSWLEGAAIQRQHWEFFNRCYRRTYAEHRSSPYLSLDFFLRIGSALPDNLALVIAERDRRPIASALFVKDQERLYGRYWGALEHVPLLHFECCYYQAIEYAIRHRLEVFEGGAQGEHKIFRGLLPVEALSAHWLAHPKFARAVEDFLQREGAGITRYVERAMRT